MPQKLNKVTKEVVRSMIIRLLTFYSLIFIFQTYLLSSNIIKINRASKDMHHFFRDIIRKNHQLLRRRFDCCFEPASNFLDRSKFLPVHRMKEFPDPS